MRYTIQEVFDMIGPEALNISEVSKSSRESIEVEGYQVYTRSMRYATFYQKGCTCVKCGRKGTYFELDADRDGNNADNRRHFNLYSDDGILMTKDHILPKKWGGADHIDNFQTMCKICNEEKGSQYDVEIDGIIALKADNLEKTKHFINIEEAIYDACNRHHVLSQGGKPSTIAKKSIHVAASILAVLDKDLPAYGYYWKHGRFKVEGQPFASSI